MNTPPFTQARLGKAAFLATLVAIAQAAAVGEIDIALRCSSRWLEERLETEHD
jgi:hypothetical protein